MKIKVFLTYRKYNDLAEHKMGYYYKSKTFLGKRYTLKNKFAGKS